MPVGHAARMAAFALRRTRSVRLRLQHFILAPDSVTSDSYSHKLFTSSRFERAKPTDFHVLGGDTVHHQILTAAIACALFGDLG